MNRIRQSARCTPVIHQYEDFMLHSTTCLLAEAYMTNPLNMKALGEDDFQTHVEFFRLALGSLKGTKVVVMSDDNIIGFMHWVHCSQCQSSLSEKLILAPQMIFSLGWRPTVRVSRWLSTWSAHDLQTEHLHLGPIAVDPVMQGYGIGGKLMEHFCKHLDEVGLDGYLETDRRENVRFYNRFGFEIIKEVSVLGVPNYMMCRKTNNLI